jgi:hypothetical protein
MNSMTPPVGRTSRPNPGLDPGTVTLARHRAQCRICRHARREEIERDFLDWVPAREIAEEYELGSHRAVYRHAHAFDLFRMRRGYVERVLDNILERSGEAKITAGGLVSAIRLLLEIESDGHWMHLSRLRDPPCPASRQTAPPPAAHENDAEGDLEDEARAPKAQRAAGPAPRDADADDRVPLKESALRIFRELEAAHPAFPPQPSPRATAALPPEETGRGFAPVCQALKTAPVTAAPNPIVLPPSAAPSPNPAPVPPGTRREPDGPPQVAGMAWPWAKNNNPFARRNRWRRRPVVG